MRIILLAMLLSLIGCGNLRSELPSPTAAEARSEAKLQDSSVQICLKDESELSISPQAQKNYLKLSDEIPSQDTEYVDCDGKVIAAGHDPVRSFESIVELKAFKRTHERIHFIEIENLRTCSVERANIRPDQELFAGLRVKENGAVFVGQHFTQAGESGRVRIAVTDLPYKLFGQTNIAQGFNLIHVRYFGECQKYRADKDEARGEAHNCLEARLIAQVEVAVDFNIVRPTQSGTRQVSVCAHH